MDNRMEIRAAARQTPWVLRGLAIVLVAAGSAFLYAGLPNQAILLVVGACLTLPGIFLVLAR